MIRSKKEKIVTNFSYSTNDLSEFIISISGNLDIDNISYLWCKVLALQQKNQPKKLIFDAKDITYCDGSGIMLISELKKRQLTQGMDFHIQNFNMEFQGLLDFFEKRQSSVYVPLEKNLVVDLGKNVITVFESFRENITFFGELLFYLLQFFLCQKSIRWQDFWRVLGNVGPAALPITLLIGFLVGVIITFQSIEPFSKIGAQIYIIDLVGLGLVREMGPLMTAILFAGRTASAFAAEIGTMKINQEIDAISTMGLDPIRFLTVPRVLTAIMMFPLLSMFLILSGLIGCFFVMHSLGYNLNMFCSELLNIITIKDFLAGLAKTFVFGPMIASIGCLYGIKTRIGASAVGVSTTNAVVASLVMLVFVDGIFAVIYYFLDI